MNLQSITIEKLFGQFDYNIVFNQDAGITILTGPNGYGKTTILNIIFQLFDNHNRRFEYLSKLNFESITIYFANGWQININRGINLSGMLYEVIKDYSRMSVELIDINNKIESFICDLNARPVDDISKNIVDKFLGLLNSQSVYFLKDQRLKQENHEQLAIETYAKDLVSIVALKKDEEIKLSQQLDNSFAKRLFACKDALPKDIFEDRFQKLIQKQWRLQVFGIYSSTIESVEYEDDNRRALSVYLEDYEQKTSLYDELLVKINLFLELLGEKYLNNKRIGFNNEKGYYFTTNNGESLKLSDLSSGEQQQVILLYELLFKAEPGSLVLIDEPETSLHVVWQQLFLSDLQKIAALKQLSFFVATHSPDIMDDKWDLSIDLYALTHKEDDNVE
jgi:predicted ATP-binding protein involved in virulence